MARKGVGVTVMIGNILLVDPTNRKNPLTSKCLFKEWIESTGNGDKLDKKSPQVLLSNWDGLAFRITHYVRALE